MGHGENEKDECYNGSFFCLVLFCYFVIYRDALGSGGCLSAPGRPALWDGTTVTTPFKLP